MKNILFIKKFYNQVRQLRFALKIKNVIYKCIYNNYTTACKDKFKVKNNQKFHIGRSVNI